MKMPIERLWNVKMLLMEDVGKTDCYKQTFEKEHIFVNQTNLTKRK